MTANRLPRRKLRRMLRASAQRLGVAGMLVLVAGAIAAQDAPNPSLVLSFGSALDVNSNQGLNPVSAGTTTRFDNRLGLAYLTKTASSTLQFDAGTVLRFSDSPDGTRTGADDPRFGLSYSRSGTNSTLSFSAAFSKARLSFFDPLGVTDGGTEPAPIDSGDLEAGGAGTRADSNLAFQFETGLGRPLGLSLRFSRRERDFTGTTDPDQFDTTTENVALGTSFRISDRTQASLNLSRSDFRSDDATQTERQTDQISLGITHALAPALSLRFSLGESRVTQQETVLGLPVSESNNGLNGNLTLERELPNGSIGLAFNRGISINGARTDITLERSLDLPSGSLDLSFGGSRGEGGEETWIGSLTYAQDLARGQVSASLDRRVGLNDADAATTTTRARLSLSQDLSLRGGLDLSIDHLDVNSDTAGDDRSRTRLRVAYTWDLTRDWQLAGGYAHTSARNESDGNAKSDAVFLSLERSFTFAP